MLTVGDKFPAFKLKAAVSLEKGKEFQDVSDDDHPGKWKVVFFWPMDFTFVCPTEIAEFGKRNTRLRRPRRAGARRQHRHEYVHLAWRKNHPDLKDLPFPMLADIKRELVDRARASCTRTKASRCARRSSSTRTAHPLVSVNDLSVGRNVDEVLRVLDALQTDELCPCNWQKGEPTLTRRGGLTCRRVESCSRAEIPEPARDIKLNLQAVLQPGSAHARAALGRGGRFGGRRPQRRRCATRSPTRASRGRPGRHRRRARRRGADGDEQRLLPLPPHGREAELREKPARLRMNRSPSRRRTRSTSSSSASRSARSTAARSCIRSHEKVVLEGGLTRGPGPRRRPHRRHDPRGGVALEVA